MRLVDLIKPGRKMGLAHYEQLLDCDEDEWADEVFELEQYLRNLKRSDFIKSK